MKKVFTLILSLLYFSLSTGALVNMHYCGGELKDININTFTENCCCGWSETDNGCCDNKQFQADINVDENAPVLKTLLPVTFFLTLYSSGQNDHDATSEAEAHQFLLDEPVPPEPAPIWLVNCKLTYYG